MRECMLSHWLTDSREPRRIDRILTYLMTELVEVPCELLE